MNKRNIEGDGYSEKGREIPEKTNPVESHQRLLILLVSIMSRPGATGRGEVGHGLAPRLRTWSEWPTRDPSS